MGRKTVTMEVVYPDCSICGAEIGENEVYYEVETRASRLTCHRGEYSTSVSSGSPKRKEYCRKCVPGDVRAEFK